MDTTFPPTKVSGHASNKKQPQFCYFTNHPLVMSAAFVVALAAIVGTCATVLLLFPASHGSESSQEVSPLDVSSMEVSLQDKEKLHSKVGPSETSCNINTYPISINTLIYICI